MSAILGTGAVTALGSAEELVSGILNGRIGNLATCRSEETGNVFEYFAPLADNTPLPPRLRRSSRISHFAMRAMQLAVADAGLSDEEKSAAAVVFAVASGGVIYSHRFYKMLVDQGANHASPMLFPETVCNAPASHIAAQLGISGLTCTLTGDGSTGISALSLADTLLKSGRCRHVIVAGAEEVDPVLCEAYSGWRLVQGPVGGKNTRNRARLGEAGAALVLSNDAPGLPRISTTASVPFFSRRDYSTAATTAYEQTTRGFPDASLIVAGRNGTFVDAVESQLFSNRLPGATLVSSKNLLGETLGASAFIQSILAVKIMRRQSLKTALVSAPGWNQHVAFALLESG